MKKIIIINKKHTHILQSDGKLFWIDKKGSDKFGIREGLELYMWQDPLCLDSVKESGEVIEDTKVFDSIPRYRMKAKIRSWINRVAKKLERSKVKELYRFEDNKDGSFKFYYDDVLYELIRYGAIYCVGYRLLESLGLEFDNLFEKTGWAGDFIQYSVMHIFKES